MLPPVEPAVTDVTPGTWRNASSTPQKHPAANVALAMISTPWFSLANLYVAILRDCGRAGAPFFYFYYRLKVKKIILKPGLRAKPVHHSPRSFVRKCS